jgi:hypothetical protein
MTKAWNHEGALVVTNLCAYEVELASFSFPL